MNTVAIYSGCLRWAERQKEHEDFIFVKIIKQNIYEI